MRTIEQIAMPPSSIFTRGHASACTLRDARSVARLAQIRHRHLAAKKLIAKEQSPRNRACSILYDDVQLQRLLLANTDADGHISRRDKKHLTGLFDRREAFRLCSPYHKVHASINVFMLKHLKQAYHSACLSARLPTCLSIWLRAVLSSYIHACRAECPRVCFLVCSLG